LVKRKPKSNPKKVAPEPVRTEKKMIHGELVEVKIYAPAYKPDDAYRVQPSSTKKHYKSGKKDNE
jgi:hypothetical protein